VVLPADASAAAAGMHCCKQTVKSTLWPGSSSSGNVYVQPTVGWLAGWSCRISVDGVDSSDSMKRQQLRKAHLVCLRQLHSVFLSVMSTHQHRGQQLH
jgi:hypothetical protein